MDRRVSADILPKMFKYNLAIPSDHKFYFSLVKKQALNKYTSFSE
jgi:hypothetical protein